MSKKDFVNEILKVAEREMLKLNHPYVGSEHMILALLKNQEIIDICNEYNLTYDVFKKELLNIIGTSNIKTTTILHTPLLKAIINDAKRDAKENNNGIVTPKHIMVSILESGDGIGVRILISLGIDLESIYKEMKNSFNPLLNEIKKYGYEMKTCENKLVGRDKEIEDILEILLRKNKNNPLLVGEAGVGKTAIVEELASRISNGFYEIFKGYKIINIDMSLILSGSKYRGDFEERLNNVIKEVLSNKKIILFIDEIHTILKAGGSEGAIDAANILKPYLSRGDLKIIGATTLDEYNKYFLKDKALVRRFDKVYINEPNLEMTRNILYNIKDNYKKYHNVTITKSNLDTILDLTNKYILDKKNPDKVIDVLDSVCSLVKNKGSNKIYKKNIEEVISRKINRNLEFDKNIILSNLTKKIYGQDNIIVDILDNILEKRKINSILLTGGIGVGKTLFVKELSKEIGMDLITIDMSDYNNYYSVNNIYNGENSLYNKLIDNSIILFDNIEKCNLIVLDKILNIINEKKIKDKSLDNSIIFLNATNKISYNIGFNTELEIVDYDNQKVLNSVDYIVRFNDINKECVNKYIEQNNIRDFDINKCDYINYGFRGIKIAINSNNYIKNSTNE